MYSSTTSLSLNSLGYIKLHQLVFELMNLVWNVAGNLFQPLLIIMRSTQLNTRSGLAPSFPQDLDANLANEACPEGPSLPRIDNNKPKSLTALHELSFQRPRPREKLLA